MLFNFDSRFTTVTCTSGTAELIKVSYDSLLKIWDVDKVFECLKTYALDKVKLLTHQMHKLVASQNNDFTADFHSKDISYF